MRTRLFISFLLAVLSAAAHAEQLYVVFTDPVRDSLGPVDVVGMGLSFDKATGAYSLLLLADAAAPFQGDLRVDINLYNPDTGTNDCDPSFFEDNLNDYLGYPASTILVLSGASHHLKSWNVGDRVATNTIPFGNPDCSSLFRSAVVDLDHPFQGDLIAYGDTFATVFAPVIFVDGFESSDTSAWSDAVGIRGLISTISLQVTPGSVPPSGGALTLLALVKDTLGYGVEGAPVNFLTEAGTLDSGGALLRTDADGQVTDVLTLTSGDIGALGRRTFVVRAQSADSSGRTIEASFLVHVLTGAPVAGFTFFISGRSVSFSNQSTGDQPLSYLWDFGDGTSPPNRTDVNPVHSYASAGTYNVTLTASNALGTDSVTKPVTVTD